MVTLRNRICRLLDHQSDWKRGDLNAALLNHLLSGRENSMDSNEETIEKRVVVNNPGQRSEVVSERTVSGPREHGVSTGTIATLAILAIIVIAGVFFVVINSNRNASPDVARQAPLIPAQQAPVIIQQPAPAQQVPVIIQQPAQPYERGNTSANDDANMQGIATKKLTENSEMAGVIMTITDAHAVLTGSVNSEATKAKAELIVKSVRGVKSVDNKIVVSG